MVIKFSKLQMNVFFIYYYLVLIILKHIILAIGNLLLQVRATICKRWGRRIHYDHNFQVPSKCYVMLLFVDLTKFVNK